MKVRSYGKASGWVGHTTGDALSGAGSLPGYGSGYGCGKASGAGSPLGKGEGSYSALRIERLPGDGWGGGLGFGSADGFASINVITPLKLSIIKSIR